jgi:uncharacterized membrane protein HdeD (DUF308 family)
MSDKQKEAGMTTPRSPRQGEPDPSAGGYRADPLSGPYGQANEAYRADQDWQQGEVSRFGPGLAAAAWPAFMAAGIASVVVGAILLAWPKETITIVAVLIGIALIVAGVLRLMDGFTSHEASGGKRVASVVVGLIAIILGLFCIRHYHFTIAALAIIAGLFWVIHGIADVAAGLFAGQFPGRGFTLLTGVLSLCAGLIVLFWPTISITVLVAVVGIWLIVYGILAAVMGFRLRGRGAGPPGSQPMAAA